MLTISSPVSPPIKDANACFFAVRFLLARSSAILLADNSISALFSGCAALPPALWQPRCPALQLGGFAPLQNRYFLLRRPSPQNNVDVADKIKRYAVAGKMGTVLLGIGNACAAIFCPAFSISCETIICQFGIIQTFISAISIYILSLDGQRRVG